MDFQFKRLTIGLSFKFIPHIKIGIRKRVMFFNKRKNEWQTVPKTFVVDLIIVSFEIGLLLN